jgi:uncharacterized membrane protein
MKMEPWLYFVVGAVLSWGVYVPVLHEGQGMLSSKEAGHGALRAFLCVGIAYFLTAVVVPLLLMWFNLLNARSGVFNGRGITFATLGGIAGAAGALCIILAIKSGGKALYIAPLVFAGAPIVSAIVSLLWKTREMPNAKFFAGIVLAAIGAGLVLYSKGELDAAKKAAPQAHAAVAPPAAPVTAEQ